MLENNSQMDLFTSDAFEARINQWLKDCKVPGLAVGIVRDQEIKSKGFGLATLKPEKPVTPDTLFDIASCSKSFTAASVATLVEDDENYPEVKWDAIVSKLLPDDFVMSQQSYTDQITVEDILSHRTGLPRHDHSYFSPRTANADTARSSTRSIRHLPIVAPLRTKFMYNNMMFTVGALLVESKTSRPFASYLHDTFWQPLGMTSTFLQPQSVVEAGLGARMATPYAIDDAAEDKSFFAIDPVQAPEAIGAGSIYTTANDHAKWVRAMMLRSGPISEAVYEGVTAPRSIEEPVGKTDPFCSHALYAAGWIVKHYRGYKFVSHDGGEEGFGSYQFFMPEIKFGAVFHGNSSESVVDVAYTIGMTLVDELLQVPERERVDWHKFLRDEDAEGEEEFKRKNVFEEEQSLDVPLERYAGDYWNDGYRKMTVQVKAGKLFIDATDRSMGFTLTLDHVKDTTDFNAHWRSRQEGGDRKAAVKFRFEGEKVVQMGAKLENRLDDLIWFDRMESLPARPA